MIARRWFNSIIRDFSWKENTCQFLWRKIPVRRFINTAIAARVNVSSDNYPRLTAQHLNICAASVARSIQIVVTAGKIRPVGSEITWNKKLNGPRTVQERTPLNGCTKIVCPLLNGWASWSSSAASFGHYWRASNGYRNHVQIPSRLTGQRL